MGNNSGHTAMHTQTVARLSTKIFADPIVDRYAAIDALATAMDNPGWLAKIESLVRPPHPVNVASAAICLACLSPCTRLWSDLGNDPLTLRWFADSCKCRICAQPEQADFALVARPVHMPALERFAAGPRASTRATLIIQLPALPPSPPFAFLSHRSRPQTAVRGIPLGFWQTWHDLRQGGSVTPDLVFTHTNSLMAMPGDWESCC